MQHNGIVPAITRQIAFSEAIHGCFMGDIESPYQKDDSKR
ncbi:hypothetical protein CEV34_0435 [Brucella pseudogrignonensis]|uniref:Uncharacterized protein n=1 Tax=Brucella pseudogrignonensis TaxID=419475 RepID=A0A256GU40_9HYPH|nr:hypothetical protein CEV34_0435 [Brucella pseudogrignonensis]